MAKISPPASSIRKRLKRPIKIITVAVLAALGFWFGYWRGQKEAPEEGKPVVKIGVVYPMSGDMAKYGEAAKTAADLFFEEFNKKERKFDYKLLFEDNQGQARLSAMVAQRLISLDKVDALISPLSHLAAPVAVLAEKNAVLNISVASDPAISARAFNFIIISNPARMAEMLYDTLSEKGVKTLSTVGVQSSGQLFFIDAVKEVVASRRGISMPEVFYVNPGEHDFKTLILKMMRQKPDYIYAQMIAPEIDIFMRQLKEQNVSIPVTGLHVFTYIQNKELAEGLWYVDSAPASSSFLQKYMGKTGSENTNYGEYVYAILEVMTNAFETTGSKDGQTLTDFITEKTHDFPSVIGSLTVEGTRQLSAPPVLKTIKNGKTVTIGDKN